MIAILLILLAPASGPAKPSKPAAVPPGIRYVTPSPSGAAASRKLVEGQVWKYRNRPGEEDSTLKILRIEKDHEGKDVVHVALRGLRLESPRTAGGVIREIPFGVYTRSAIERSVTTVVSKEPPPETMPPAYEQWKKMNTQGHGGSWDLPVAETLATLESHLKQAAAAQLAGKKSGGAHPSGPVGVPAPSRAGGTAAPTGKKP